MDDAKYKKGSDDPLVRLARKTIEGYLNKTSDMNLFDLPHKEPVRAGCFVSLHRCSTGDLRGCIGTIEPTQKDLKHEIINNAISAATKDPRFSPVRRDELDDICISVDVLFAPEPATMTDLDPKRYGVIVTKGLKRGLLLPALEGVETAKDQVRIACMKAGIEPRSSFNIERFEVERHI